MKYIALEEVQLSKKENKFVNAAAQCMLQLLANRLCEVEDDRDFILDEEFSIDYDFSMYGEEIMKMKEEMGYSSDKLIDSANNFVRKL